MEWIYLLITSVCLLIPYYGINIFMDVNKKEINDETETVELEMNDTDDVEIINENYFESEIEFSEASLQQEEESSFELDQELDEVSIESIEVNDIEEVSFTPSDSESNDVEIETFTLDQFIKEAAKVASDIDFTSDERKVKSDFVLTA